MMDVRARITGLALRCGISSPRRAGQGASAARQWGAPLFIGMLLMNPLIASAQTTSGEEGMDEQRTEAQGWQWYNEHQEEALPVAPPAVRPPSASERKKRYQQATQEALDRAILDSSPEHAAEYMRWQHYWTDRAGKFSQSTKAAMLKYPELDYNLQYSHYNGTVKEQLAIDQAKEKAAIATLAQRYGVFFFYRGNHPLDRLLCSVITHFASTHQVNVIPISVDGVGSPALPHSRRDAGQSKKMGIKHFPALFLVDPKRETYQPLAYGFITPDDLAKQFLNVATGFKGEF